MKEKSTIVPHVSVTSVDSEPNSKYHIRVRPQIIAASSHPFRLISLNPNTKKTFKLRYQNHDEDKSEPKGCLTRNILQYNEAPDPSVQSQAIKISAHLNNDSSEVKGILNCTPKRIKESDLLGRRLLKNAISSSIHNVFKSIAAEDVKAQRLIHEMVTSKSKHSRSESRSTYNFLNGTSSDVRKPTGRRMIHQGLHSSQLDFKNWDTHLDNKISNRRLQFMNFSNHHCKSSVFSNDISHVKKKRARSTNEVSKSAGKERVYKPTLKCKPIADVRNPITGEFMSYSQLSLK